jgi:hypothetical protein
MQRRAILLSALLCCMFLLSSCESPSNTEQYGNLFFGEWEIEKIIYDGGEHPIGGSPKDLVGKQLGYYSNHLVYDNETEHPINNPVYAYNILLTEGQDFWSAEYPSPAEMGLTKTNVIAVNINVSFKEYFNNARDVRDIFDTFYIKDNKTLILNSKASLFELKRIRT